MRWRRWLWKSAKWACTLAAAAGVAVAILSRLYVCSYTTPFGGTTAAYFVTVDGGLVYLSEYKGPVRRSSPLFHPGWKVQRCEKWRWGTANEAATNEPGWHHGVVWHDQPPFFRVGANLAYVVALASIPAALLWYAERRRLRPGLCGKCGYDRRGLVGGVDAKCPECGTVPAPASK